MNATNKAKLQMLGAWCGIFYCLAALIGWALIAKFIPPHSPSATASEIAAIFQSDTTRIRIGMVFTMFAAFFAIPFSAITSHYLARVEGGAGILAYSALLGGAGVMVLTFYPAVWWLVAAYRPERAPELIYLLNDMAWLQFVGGVSMYLAMPLSIIAAAFCDTSETPVFPRWVGFANIWIMLMMLPDQLLYFFHGGPFAWNGLFGLWIPLAAFIAWFGVVFHCLKKAIRRDLGLVLQVVPARRSA